METKPYYDDEMVIDENLLKGRLLEAVDSLIGIIQSWKELLKRSQMPMLYYFQMVQVLELILDCQISEVLKDSGKVLKKNLFNHV